MRLLLKLLLFCALAGIAVRRGWLLAPEQWLWEQAVAAGLRAEVPEPLLTARLSLDMITGLWAGLPGIWGAMMVLAAIGTLLAVAMAILRWVLDLVA